MWLLQHTSFVKYSYLHAHMMSYHLSLMYIFALPYSFTLGTMVRDSKWALKNMTMLIYCYKSRYLGIYKFRNLGSSLTHQF